MVRLRSPLDRVRRRVADEVGQAVAEALPAGFQRMGSVAVVKLPESMRAEFPAIGAAYRQELGLTAVLRRTDSVQGEFRVPSVETIAAGTTETEVLEHGVRYRFDAARLMFSAGNQSERAEAGRLVTRGETVVDMFAGIGYFALPALLHGGAQQVHACEANPVSFGYLLSNARLNGVQDRLTPYLGDNRKVGPRAGVADRVFLGFLPDSLPWLERGLAFLSPRGGSLHLHRLQGSREADSAALGPVVDRVRSAGRHLRSAEVRRVKRYGPGRFHVVVDAVVGPVSAAARSTAGADPQA